MLPCMEQPEQEVASDAIVGHRIQRQERGKRGSRTSGGSRRPSRPRQEQLGGTVGQHIHEQVWPGIRLSVDCARLAPSATPQTLIPYVGKVYWAKQS
jgi:hypothetical protein